MKKVITDYFDEIVKLNKKKTIFIENDKNYINYIDFSNKSKSIASHIINTTNLFKKPIAIFVDKSIDTLVSMISVLYSGNFYTIIDCNSPKNRISMIIEILKPEYILTNNENIEKLKLLDLNIKIINIDNISSSIDKKGLLNINKKMISTDLAYVLFTSGSTGVPKGTVITHNSVISYISWFIETFDINDKTIFGNQTPFYFSMSVSDIYATLFTGAKLCIIPPSYFSFPVNLVNYLNQYKVNTIYWVPSALSIVAKFKTFDYVLPNTLEKILFAGETMPMTTLNSWRKYLPNKYYANLFGPTETTDICTYYVVNRKFKNDETLPIGHSCNNCDTLIINEHGNIAKEGEIGELYIRGLFLANGYYNNEEKTKNAFMQNPTNKEYPEIVYKTGDLGKINKYGEIEYLGRIDFQIKHMGYRIELGEIENNMNSFEGITLCACIYDQKNKKIVIFYEGSKTEEEVVNFANKKLVQYMRPNIYIKVLKIPLNANGKLDRVKLKEIYEEKNYE